MLGRQVAGLLSAALVLGAVAIALDLQNGAAQFAAASEPTSRNSGKCEQTYQKCLKDKKDMRGGAIICEANWSKCVGDKCKTKRTGNQIACPKDADCEMSCTESASGKSKLTASCCEGGPKRNNTCRKKIDGKCVTGMKDTISDPIDPLVPPGTCAKDDPDCYMDMLQQLERGKETKGDGDQSSLPRNAQLTRGQIPPDALDRGILDAFANEQPQPAGLKVVPKPFPPFGEGEPPWDTDLDAHRGDGPPLPLEDWLVLEQMKMGPREFARRYPEYSIIPPELLNLGLDYTLPSVPQPNAPTSPPETFDVPEAPVPSLPQPPSRWRNFFDRLLGLWPI